MMILMVFIKHGAGLVWLNGEAEFDENVIVAAGDEILVEGVAECVFPGTEILTSLDGNSVPAEDIQKGDNIVYFNFETKKEEVGKVYKTFVHDCAEDFVRYEFADGTYIEVTDYHPIYTKEGWKSLTRRNGYEIPEVGDEVKTPTGWKKLNKIETWEGTEDCYNFIVITEEGERIYNYYGNGTLVEGPTELKDIEF